MAAGVTIKHKRKAGAFSNGELAAGELGLDTTNSVWYFSSNGTTVVALPSTASVTALIAAAVTGLFDFKGATDCSANPNYPSALKGDIYVVSVAGKNGGASGKSVDVSDMYVATADNAGGTDASVGTSWTVLEHNLVGALLSANNLSDISNAGTARTNLGLGTMATQNASAVNISGGNIVANIVRATQMQLPDSYGGDGTHSIAFRNASTSMTGGRTLFLDMGDATCNVTITGDTSLSGTNTGNETTASIGATINGASAATPNNSDLVATVESSVIKKITWTNVKAFLKTYFDSVYQAILVSGTNIKTVNSTSLLGSGDLVIAPALRCSADIGDGSTTDIVVTHSLGTRDLAVSVRSTTSPYEQIVPDVEFTSTTTATIKFTTAPTTGQYRVTFVG